MRALGRLLALCRVAAAGRLFQAAPAPWVAGLHAGADLALPQLRLAPSGPLLGRAPPSAPLAAPPAPAPSGSLGPLLGALSVGALALVAAPAPSFGRGRGGAGRSGGPGRRKAEEEESIAEVTARLEAILKRADATALPAVERGALARALEVEVERASASPLRSAGPPSGRALDDFFRGVDRYPNLTREEEVSLGQAIEIGNEAKSLLEEKVHTEYLKWQDLRTYTEQDLAWIADQGELAFCLFVVSNLRLVVWVARRFCPYRAWTEELVDLVQDGNIGLIKSVEKWDWRRRNRFSTYAAWWIRSTMQRGQVKAQHIRLPVHMREKVERWRKEHSLFLSDHDRPPTTEEMAEIMGLSGCALDALVKAMDMRMVSLDDTEIFGGGRGFRPDAAQTLLDSDLTDQPQASESALMEAELQRSITCLVKELPAIEALILTQLYGLDGGGFRSVTQVSSSLSLPKHNVQYIHSKSLKRLKSSKRDMLELLHETSFEHLGDR